MGPLLAVCPRHQCHMTSRFYAQLGRMMAQLFFSGGCDKQVKMWPLLSGGQPVTVAMHDAPVKEIAWIPKMNLLEASGADLQSTEVLINVDHEEPSWWFWVTDEMVPSDVEEQSGIDNEKYLVVCEEQAVDGVATFMARCVLSNPKAQTLTPEELQKTLNKALGGMNKLEKMLNVWHAGKLFYTLSTWGLALAGLSRTRVNK
ncbi:Protein RAE1 [Camellia lanceoleosa]|uniref:Protein RAE1 n=1 Tax=Camellia lanceoleosa TaxID=1840588 RepID=A0ACC0GDE9_9ERIC|nr:Protein RAE1 [Camellia lanceoleosa]